MYAIPGTHEKRGGASTGTRFRRRRWMPLNAPVPLSAAEGEAQLCQALTESLRLDDAASSSTLRPPRHADVSDKFLTPRSSRDDGPREPETEPTPCGYPEGCPRLVARRDLPTEPDVRLYAVWGAQHGAGCKELAGVHVGRGTAGPPRP